MAKYEVYESIEGRKKRYLVFDGKEKPDEAYRASARFFRASEDHIFFRACWILNNKLYFDFPDNEKAKKKYAFFYKK